MAEVVVEQSSQTQSSGGITSGLTGIFDWFARYWWVILIVILLIGAIVLVIWLVYKWGLEKKRKDPMFVFYEQCIDACKLNMRKDFIVKKRKWWFFLLGFFSSPLLGLMYLFMFRGESFVLLFVWIVIGFLMWLPFAFFFYKDLSMRIINVDMQTRGRYRGHARRMDGFIYMIVCVGKKWIFLDDNLLLKLPEHVLTMKTKVTKTKDGDIKKSELQWDKIVIDKYNWNERDNYIFIPFTSLVREDTYYYYPTFIEGTKIVDLRQKIAMSYHLMTQISMAEQSYSHLGKVTNEAVDANVGVTAQKKMPEKQRDVENGNEKKE
jgi:hypothetical protein